MLSIGRVRSETGVIAVEDGYSLTWGSWSLLGLLPDISKVTLG